MSLIVNPVNQEMQKRKAVSQLLNLPSIQFSVFFDNWKQGMELLWGNPELTADILKGLGTRGAELFDLSSKTVMFFETVNPGCTNEILSKMKPFTINSDGTVTLN